MAKPKAAPNDTMADRFLEDARESGTPLSVYLVSGFQLKGEVVDFDEAAILFNHRGTHQMVMRTAVANMYPLGMAKGAGEPWWTRYVDSG